MENMKKKKKMLVPIILVVLVFLIAAGAGAFFATFFGYSNDKPTEKKEGMLVAGNKATIMIMGVDSRHDDVGRSDTLMIATVDPDKNQAALLSIPRDTRVKIRNHGWDKINAAYAYGGHNLSKETVENFLGVPMDHYIIINIEAFQKIIDAIGGIDINVEKRMYYNDPWDDNGGLHINLQPGMQHMDGKTAVTYVRYRDTEGDIGRIGRQQKFMKAVMDKVLSPSIIPRIPAIVTEVFAAVKTDMSIRQLLAFFGSLKESHDNGLKTAMVPGTPMYINGISYWIPDITKLRSALADTLDVDITPAIRNSMEQADREYKNSVPSTATLAPAQATIIHQPNEEKSTSAKTSKTKKKDDAAISEKTQPSASTKSETSEPSAAPANNTSPADNPIPATGPSRGNSSIGKN
ncbi:LCP family protein [Pectinatus brassicae]|uniref:LCP family protein required for cell wall assembly n=1 Tax=Pectinatus brassicae TaxID=862415 RepID=A0A840UBX1_9FIRM|nr:LCP family protein [Pectinatus brassicae]MBB5335231.1 LCP family protein required for cell wall assembly [Pectinatus brassicae]